MEDPVNCRLVLPLTCFQQIARDGDSAGPTHALRRLVRVRQPEYLVASRDQDLDQCSANEAIGSGDECRGHCAP